MNEIAVRIIAATVTLVLVYYFFKDTRATNELIAGAAGGYAKVVGALQGR